MTAKEYAEKLKNEFFNSVTFHDLEPYMEGEKKCALIVIDKIEEALREYGDDSYELQNMDRTFAYYEEVRNEINNYYE